MKGQTVDSIYALLDQVKDPEIPVISIVDLGIISFVKVDGNSVQITLTPTFVGCPALDTIKNDITDTLRQAGIADVKVTVSFKNPWSSSKISEKGRAAMRSFGLAPPPQGVFEDLTILESAVCPRCGSEDTELRSQFGSTLCRSIHFCPQCRESFEQFKPL